MNTNIATEVQTLVKKAVPLQVRLDYLKQEQKKIEAEIEVKKQRALIARKRNAEMNLRVMAEVAHAQVCGEVQNYKDFGKTLKKIFNYKKILATLTGNKSEELKKNEKRAAELFKIEPPVVLTRSRGWLHEQERVKIAFYAQNLPKVTDRANCVFHHTLIAIRFNCSLATVKNYAKYSE
jgi:hypothetical protein